ncbi:hypothetical protein [Haloferula sp.]|uniref:hypothetical protein n=1 Tax=Haloferula sp. TaxID=2497595 RepID=UPI00329C4A74
MKHSLLQLPIIAALLMLPASAAEEKQSDTRPVPSNLTSEEKVRVLSTASRLLDDAIAYKGDGTATTIYRSNGRRMLLEMRGLVVRQLIHGSVAIEEREAGVTRRFYAQLHAKAFRTSVSGGKNWTTWQNTSCPFFPSHILVEEVDGKLTLSVPALAKFTPTPDPKTIAPIGKLMPHEQIMAHR